MLKSICIFTLLSAISFVNFAQSIIQIDDFSASTEDLQLLGQAEAGAEYLRLTPHEVETTGACWLKSEKIDLSRGFETEFEFRVLSPGDGMESGAGFAFVIQNQSDKAMGSAGDDMGYAGIERALVLRMDTHTGKANFIEIAYQKEGSTTYSRHATVHNIPELIDGKPHFARVHYKEGFLTLFLDSYIFPVLSSRLDIASIVGTDDNRAWIGFTAATGAATAYHDLLKWNAEYYLPPPNIEEDKVEVDFKHNVTVKSRHIDILVSDYNKIDGDIISLKFGDKWILTEHPLEKKAHVISTTITGFAGELIMYANNTGSVPPNTASIIIDDGHSEQEIRVKSDLKSSEAIKIHVEE